MPLTDKQKKKVIADYIETQNIAEAGRRNGISKTSAHRIVTAERGDDLERKVTEKKEENTQDILTYMDTLYEKKKEVLRLSLDNMIDKLEQDKVTPNSLAVIYGTLLDKELKFKEIGLKNKEIDKTERKEIVIVNDMPKDDDVDEEDNN